MKARHLFAIFVGAGLILWSLASCNLNSVSISDRIGDFQSDLNTSSRTNVYNDFHPTMTAAYGPLKDPVGSGFNLAYPPPGPSYSLSIVDQSNPSAGVIVAVNSGSSGPGYSFPYYLKLTMATYNSNDWRIVTLSDCQTQNGTYALRYS
ncbi:MAG: hypothetical protein ABSG85_06330 [Spirochaetia bacterium]|jgi:hypothetical protein